MEKQTIAVANVVLTATLLSTIEAELNVGFNDFVTILGNAIPGLHADKIPPQNIIIGPNSFHDRQPDEKNWHWDQDWPHKSLLVLHVDEVGVNVKFMFDRLLELKAPVIFVYPPSLWDGMWSFHLFHHTQSTLNSSRVPDIAEVDADNTSLSELSDYDLIWAEWKEPIST